MEGLNSVKILGEGTITGGEYNKVSVVGDAEAIGFFKSNVLKVTGECNIREGAEFDTAKIVGEVKSQKKTIINELLEILGEFTAFDECSVKNLKVLGEGIFRKNLTFDYINIKGVINVDGDCEGNVIDSEGAINVTGLLTADRIGISPRGACIINEIGCSELQIRKKPWSFFNKGFVICKSIEADKVILENTECKIVSGKDITILGGCTIDKVEYSGTLTVDEDSKVGERICLKD